ncbi:hypothetical protein [Luteimonas mephitis]|uniref:hypothetical protein n=1 Tax=Luteimonas mephitis TaxID=83615 RepID=UPI00047C7FDC|nr:hypothetical protein [Luteimonas mephitis]
MKNSIAIKAVALSMALMLTSGCDQEVKEGTAHVKLTIPGLLELENTIKYGKKQEKLHLFEMSAAAIVAQSSVRLSTTNAEIPDQTTLATLSVLDSSGNVVEAHTFAASVQSGMGRFANPAQVENWVNNIDVPDEGALKISASNIEITPPHEGTYSATNTMVIDGQTIASATASRTVDGPGGPKPPTDPK